MPRDSAANPMGCYESVTSPNMPDALEGAKRIAAVDAKTPVAFAEGGSGEQPAA